MIKVLLVVTILAAGPPPPHSSATITLPGEAGMTFKAGPGVELAHQYCLTCHSSAYVSTQPPFTKAQWTASILKMRTVYGAKIPDNDVERLADYLTTQYGKR